MVHPYRMGLAMSSNMYSPISEILMNWMSNHIKSFQPRLCCEFEGDIDSRLLTLLVQDIASWDTICFFIFSNKGNATSAEIVSQSKLSEILKYNISRGNTISIVDPTNGSGCTVDWEGYAHDPQDSEVLIVTWGEHETLASLLVDQMGNGEVFRGN